MGTVLNDMLSDPYLDVFNLDDYEFRLFIQDHREQILAKCTTVVLTPNDQAKYKYRPRYYLYTNEYPPAADWVLLWINDFTGPMEFVKISKLKIPNWSMFEDLYELYRTIKSNHSEAKKALLTA